MVVILFLIPLLFILGWFFTRWNNSIAETICYFLFIFFIIKMSPVSGCLRLLIISFCLLFFDICWSIFQKLFIFTYIFTSIYFFLIICFFKEVNLLQSFLYSIFLTQHYVTQISVYKTL